MVVVWIGAEVYALSMARGGGLYEVIKVRSQFVAQDLRNAISNLWMNWIDIDQVRVILGVSSVK